MLIEFLRIWYRPAEIQKLRSAGLNQTTQAYIDAAWERSQTTPDPRLKLLKHEIEVANAENRTQELATLWEEKAATTNNAEDWFQAGYFFDEINKDYARAITCYDKAIEMDPKDAYAWHNKGVSLQNLGRDEDALTCYDKAIEIDPKDAVAWSNKGASLGCLGRYEEALTCYNKAIEIDPNSASPWNNRGSSLHNLRQHVEALTCYDRAIEISPFLDCPRFNRSEVFFAMQRWDEGFEAIRVAFERSKLDYLGDCAAMFSLIFQLSEDDAELKSRISTLVDLYQQAAEEHGFRRPDPRAKATGVNHTTAGDGGSIADNLKPDQRPPRPAVNPLSHLADGLVKSLAKIDKNRVTPAVLQSYVVAVERRVAALSEFEIPLRLFRYGIRYLISSRESEFVELIQAERRILRQALGLPEET
jgi:tetratricopeptide (TPR) repeat protein